MGKSKKPHRPLKGAKSEFGVLVQQMRDLNGRLRELYTNADGPIAEQVHRLAQELEIVTSSVESYADQSIIPQKPTNPSPHDNPASAPSDKVQDLSEPFPFHTHLVTDATGRIQLADQSILRVFGLSPSKIVGKNLLDFLSLENRLVLNQHLQKLQAGEPGLEWDMTLSPVTGNSLQAVITISALRTSEGAISSVHWLVRDRSAYQRALSRGRLIQALGEHILEGMSLSEALNHICQHFVQVFAYPLVFVAMKDPDGTLKVNGMGGTLPFLAHVHDLVLSEADLCSFKTVMESCSSQVHKAGKANGGRDLITQRYGLGACLAVPLQRSNQALGVLVAGAKSPEAFDPFLVDWFTTLGSQIAASLLLLKEFEHLRVREAAIATAEHAVLITDPEGRIVWVNEAYTRLSGFSAAELVGTKPKVFESQKLQAAIKQARRPSSSEKFWRHELVDQRKDGRAFMVEQVFTPLRNDHGHVTHFVAIHQDITRRKETEARFFHLAHHDPLTDLPNRTMFFDRLTQALGQARRHNRAVGLIFLDLDRFKTINDSFGHDIGDVLLRKVAERLTRCVRSTDTVARLSGDEFTIILQDLERGQDAGHVAQKILDTLSLPIDLEGRVLVPHASVGIAVYPIDGEDPESLLIQADRGMYRAKEKGGDCYQFISEELNAQAFERLVVENSLQKAWEQKEFILHFQPEVDLNSGQLVGMESLIRWQHPELGLIFPHQFLSQVKDVKFFTSLQEWVLRQTCWQQQEWMKGGLLVCPMSVNLWLNHDDPHVLLDTLSGLINETNMDPKNLVLEIPYSFVLEKKEGIVPFVQKVTDWGMTCVLDDVSEAEGLSAILERIPFHRIKLASELVEKLPSMDNAVRQAEECFRISRMRGISVSANGVESAQQVTFLREHECHHVQGYLCSRPLPPDEMTELLRGWWGSEF